MRISVLDLTHSPSPLLDGLPTPGEQIVRWLAPELPEADFTIHAVAHGAPLPETRAFDGLVVSGSEKGVYDDTPWIGPLRALLLAVRETRQPVFGICFGHQVMADTFGGRAGKADHGVAVGVRRFEGAGGAFDAHVWHQDQVTAVPPGAAITCHAPYCPVGGLAYDFPALSVQAHPEYSETQLRALFQRGRGIFIAPDDADAAIASFRGSSVAPDLLAQRTAEFFRSAAHAP